MRKLLGLGISLSLALALLGHSSAANAVDLRTCAEGGICAIGDTGPGGGVVFFVKSTGAFSASQSVMRNSMTMGPITDTVTVSLTLEEHEALQFDYLEVAPITGFGFTTWANDIPWSTTGLPLMSKNIGSGQAGTTAILNAFPTQTSLNNAAHYASGYVGNGLSDWFLPSMDELALITIQHFAGTLGPADPVQAVLAVGNFYSLSTTDLETGSVVRIDPSWDKDYNVSGGAVSVVPIRAFSSGVEQAVISQPPPSKEYENLMPARSVTKKAIFRFGSLVLQDSRQAMIDKLFLESGSNASYRITAGVKDLLGTSKAEEQALAIRRAKLVKAYLVKIGAKKSSITLRTKLYSKSAKPKTTVLARYIIQ